MKSESEMLIRHRDPNMMPIVLIGGSQLENVSNTKYG